MNKRDFVARLSPTDHSVDNNVDVWSESGFLDRYSYFCFCCCCHRCFVVVVVVVVFCISEEGLNRSPSKFTSLFF